MRYFLIDIKHILTVYAINDQQLWMNYSLHIAINKIFYMPISHILSIARVDIVGKTLTLTLWNLSVLLYSLQLLSHHTLKTLLLTPLLFVHSLLSWFLQPTPDVPLPLKHLPKSVLFLLLLSAFSYLTLTLPPLSNIAVLPLLLNWTTAPSRLVARKGWGHLGLAYLNLHNPIQTRHLVMRSVLLTSWPLRPNRTETLIKHWLLCPIILFTPLVAGLHLQPHDLVVTGLTAVGWCKRRIALLFFERWSAWIHFDFLETFLACIKGKILSQTGTRRYYRFLDWFLVGVWATWWFLCWFSVRLDTVMSGFDVIVGG